MIVQNWVIVGLIGASIVAAFNIYQKYAIDDKGFDPLDIALQMHLIGAVIIIPLISVVPYQDNIGNLATFEITEFLSLYIPGIPGLELTTVIIGTGIVNAVSFWLLASAYSDDALSVIAPLRGVTPVVVAFLEPIFFSSVNYQLNLVASSIIVSIGVYVVLYEDDIYKPVRRLKDTGVIKGIASAIVIGFAVIIDRYAMVGFDLDPINYTGALILSTLFFTSLITIIIKGKKSLNIVQINLETTVLGILRTCSVVFAIVALSLVEGTRVNVIWQINVVLAAVFGGSLLSEENILRRGLGASLVIIAAGIVVFF